jgi:RimJ/RimL family protein N-acetyltransferase
MAGMVTFPRLFGRTTILPAQHATVTLPGGQRIRLSEARASDSDLVKRMFYRLTPTTVYHRLFVPAPQTPDWATRFATLTMAASAPGSVSKAAFQAGEIVGICNFVPSATTAHEAEMAIVVEDAWQGKGLGRALLSGLVVEARRLNITVFTATILGDNSRALRFVTRFFPQIEVRLIDREYEVRAILNIGEAEK